MEWASQEFFRKLLTAATEVPSLDSEVGHDEEGEDDEGSTPHRPAIPDRLDEVAEHDGKDDAPYTGSSSENSERCTAAFLEPAAD